MAKQIVSIPHKFRLAGAISFRKDYSPPLFRHLDPTNRNISKHEKFTNSDYTRNFIILYRLLCMDSGAQNLTTTTRHDILSIVMFPELIKTYNRRYKIDKVNMQLSNFNSIESSTVFLGVNFLPDLSFYLNMLH